MNLISTKVHVCGAPPLCLFAFIIEPVLKLPIHRVFCEQNKLKIQTGAESAVKPSQKWTECENGEEEKVFSWIIFARYPLFPNFFTHFPSTKSTKHNLLGTNKIKLRSRTEGEFKTLKKTHWRAVMPKSTKQFLWWFITMDC